MYSYNRCCIAGCASRRKDIHFYKFPKNENTRRQWLKFINCENLQSLSQEVIDKRFVCLKHFEKRFVVTDRNLVRSRIRVGGYPTLVTDNEIATGVPDFPEDPAEVSVTKQEHDYTRKRQHEDHAYCKADLPKLLCSNEIEQKMHRFPSHRRYPERFRSWVTLLGGKLESTMDYEYYQKKRVCHIHFIDDDITCSNRLGYKAIPSLHLPDKCIGSNEQQESVPESAPQEKEDDEAITYKCVLCDKKGITPSSEELVLSRFPLDPAICRTWVKRVGLKELLGIPIQKLNETTFLCQQHFNPGCFKKKDDLIILKDTATPSIDLYYPPLPEELMSVFPKEDQTESHPDLTDTKAENILMNDESQDFNNVEYLEEDLYDDANTFEFVELRDDYRAHNVKPAIAIHEQDSSTDEIDNLFSSYMVTFRKFPAKLQTMLKFDLAKLFARYEMKNAALQSASDEQQQAMDDTSSTIVLEETETAEKKEKRKFSQPHPYIVTNDPPKIVTHSKIMMPKSGVSNKDTESATYKDTESATYKDTESATYKDTESATNKSTSKEKPLLNNVAIIKKRVIDSEDKDTVVLKTYAQYQKPIKVRKLKEDGNKEAETARRLSNRQDSQGTGALLNTDRSSKKLTTESDKISQSQESAS